MSVQARVNNLFGGADIIPTLTATSAGTLTIPAGATFINITAASVLTVGSATVAAFSLPAASRNRLLFFYNSGNNAITFKNIDTPSMTSTTTVGFMDLGGSDRVLDNTDIICVYVRADGSAIRVFSTLDNT